MKERPLTNRLWVLQINNSLQHYNAKLPLAQENYIPYKIKLLPYPSIRWENNVESMMMMMMFFY